MNDITVIFRYIALAQAAFAITYLLLFRERNRTIVLFAVFFIAVCSPIILHILYHSGLTYKHPRLNYIPIGFYYLGSPIYYLYVKSLFEKIQIKEIIIFTIPAILEFLFVLYLFILPVNESIAIHSKYNWLFTIFFGIFLNLFCLVFIGLVIGRIYSYHKKYLNFFSNTQKVNLNWIKYTSIIIAVNYVFQLVTIPFLFEQHQKDLVYFIDSIVTVVSVYWVAIFGIKQVHLPVGYQVFESTKVVPTTNPDDFEKIESVITTSRVYKNPNLTVVDLSEMVQLHPKKVSQAINQYSNKNFNHFVNQFRIEEAKRLLADDAYDNLTIEAIAKEAGFNSKSVFNTLFKNDTGTTPKAFKNRVEE